MLSFLWKSPQNTPKMDAKKSDTPAPLASAWQVRAEAGEPVAVVRVRNLQSAIPVGRDAWGRPNKLQPVLLSSEVSFAQPFGTASADDTVNAETVHYGSLSKALLGGIELWGQGNKPARTPVASAIVATGAAEMESPRTADVFELLWVRITGRVVDGSRVALPVDQVPFLDATKLRSLSLTMHLPKASLLGAGVSLTTTAGFKEVLEDNPLRSYSRSLRIHGLHVPTLIGINSNERKAKQMVVADVEIDRFDVGDDIHSDLERTIVDAMESSSFETLEALGTHVANKVLSEFRIGDNPAPMKERGWQVRVCLEKPIAVPFAECPSVEIKIGS
ncbi:Uu.00g038540.m01.CDS01 [Anthostomella pinea]|uniref:dihydroneopterin aldolase n=1 Tax=Anthostomella pinea TaxID=933095 RepID=A0AAI8YDN3_9PEZI|nr:Uu.00g038540.m01.CDS01 [Anthostomella pinea]